MKSRIKILLALVPLTVFLFSAFRPFPEWQSKFVSQDKNGLLIYHADEKGNKIPDFSRVGYYHGDKEIPTITVVKKLSPTDGTQDGELIQAAINEVSKLPPDANGFRGAILLTKGVYKIPGSININASGIVLRGEGNTEEGTRLIALTDKHDPLIDVSGTGDVKEIAGTRVRVTDEYVPVGATSFTVSNASIFKKGDRVILSRTVNDDWIKALRMDRIEERKGTKQWQAREYSLRFERVITDVKGSKLWIDNPVMEPLDAKYGAAELYKYSFDGRISHVGIENIFFKSQYNSDTAENHSWDAVAFNKIENGSIRNVTARYFSFSCVNLGAWAKNISVLDSKCFDHKSVITGGRRYSFSNNGQLNLFINCEASDGRHDFVTGARVCGPNAFVNCNATNTHADIGPHHRWSVGTLYDNIRTDGEINIQDRGNWGSGHGWAGVTQIVWNCTVKRAAVQSPWASGKNYCIGLKGEKYDGRFKGRPDGEWEGQNQDGLQPQSLYKAQLKNRKRK